MMKLALALWPIASFAAATYQVSCFAPPDGRSVSLSGITGPNGGGVTCQSASTTGEAAFANIAIGPAGSLISLRSSSAHGIASASMEWTDVLLITGGSGSAELLLLRGAETTKFPFAYNVPFTVSFSAGATLIFGSFDLSTPSLWSISNGIGGYGSLLGTQSLYPGLTLASDPEPSTFSLFVLSVFAVALGRKVLGRRVHFCGKGQRIKMPSCRTT